MKSSLLFLAFLASAVGIFSPLFNTSKLPKDVVQHYGYINVNSKYNANVFYWFFESQGTPSSDPVVLWLTGGPGCSSELALFFENGPYTVDGNGNLSPNPYSCNSFTNLLYVDQPVGTGFSYATVIIFTTNNKWERRCTHSCKDSSLNSLNMPNNRSS